MTLEELIVAVKAIQVKAHSGQPLTDEDRQLMQQYKDAVDAEINNLNSP